jgi:FkbM family methyltransferase
MDKAFFVPLVARLVEADVLGNTDASFIAHMLARYYVTRGGPEGSSGAIYDIGANKGDTSQVLISALVPAFFCYRYYTLTQAAGAACPQWFFPFYAAEMNPSTAAMLQRRAQFERWDLLSYVVIEAGFSDAPGEARLREGGEGAGSEVASLAGWASAGAAAAPGDTVVPLHSVDSWREARGEASAPIFFLKVDTEGFDGKVLKGAERALRGGHIKFLVAEYNSMWAGVAGADGAPEWSLQSSTAFLWGLGYECHLLTSQHFVPLWGAWFDASYEFWRHSNFVCALHCDPDLLHLVAAARNASLPLLERPDCPQG